MPKPKLILVTVGTSALDKCRNVRNDLKSEEFADLLNRKGESSQLYTETKTDILQNLKNNTNLSLEGRLAGYSRLSAEIASLLAMHNDSSIGEITNEDKIILLHSDTVDGKLCAEVNAQVICETLMKCPHVTPIVKESENGKDVVTFFESSTSSGEIIQMIRLVGLQPQNAGVFVEKGLTNLFKRTKNLLESHCNEWQRFINITGGYKGEIPIQTLQAELKNIPIVYLFEYAELVKMTFTGDGVELWVGNQSTPAATISTRRREEEIER